MKKPNAFVEDADTALETGIAPEADASGLPEWVTKEQCGRLYGISADRFVDVARTLRIERRREGRVFFYALAGVLAGLQKRQDERRERNHAHAERMRETQQRKRDAVAVQEAPPEARQLLPQTPPALSVSQMDKITVYQQIAVNMERLIAAVSQA